jgi:hypothetical protein
MPDTKQLSCTAIILNPESILQNTVFGIKNANEYGEADAHCNEVIRAAD